MRSGSLARAFSRLGWIGFWIQIAIVSIPLLLTVYAFLFGRKTGPGTRGGLLLVEYLTFVGIVILLFTTVWSYRYTRLARRIADPKRRPPQSKVQRSAWIGVAASALGIMFSMVLMLFEVGQLLIHFLRAPQAGVPAIQTTGSGVASWVSAADMMSLMALALTMFAEFTVLAFSLRLLFRAMMPSEEFPLAGARR